MGHKPPPAKIYLRESDVLNAAIRWLYAHGMQPIRNNSGAYKKPYTSKKTGETSSHYIRYGKKDTGDIVCCTKTGRWLEVECKSGDGEQSPGQIERQRHVEALGGYLHISAQP